MQTIHTIPDFRVWRRSAANKFVAFVPTMGALHEGHASLVREARKFAGPSGLVAATIFVNPTQFGPSEDFSKYPRTLDADAALLARNGCDVLFAPSAEEMYPSIRQFSVQHSTFSVSVDPGPLANILEDAIRPGHFRGVCTIVLKLLNIVQPHKLVMGQKDYQQNAVLRQMIRDLDVPAEHVMCPTIREADGLAMSSRNRYLSADERARAVAIYEALSWAAAQYASGGRDGAALKAGMTQRIQQRGLRVQYAIAAHADTLAEYSTIDGPCVLLVAAVLGTTRLIDNMILP